MDDQFQSYCRSLMSYFDAGAVADAKAHARREYPKECCGLIVSDRYIPCFNYAKDPLTDFEISPAAYSRAKAEGVLQAVVHSHPDGLIFPTGLDMERQIATAVPWLILPLNDSVVLDPVAFGDPLPPAPLLGRPFVHGVFDCYSLVRDYYRTERGIELPAVAREDEWWNKGQDLYLDYLSKVGFREITMGEARPGDGFLIRFLGSDKLNHAGVLLDDGLILHHLPTRVSRREPAGIWARSADMWVRHEALDG